MFVLKLCGIKRIFCSLKISGTHFVLKLIFKLKSVNLAIKNLVKKVLFFVARGKLFLVNLNFSIMIVKTYIMNNAFSKFQFKNVVV